jgi:histone H3/H4
VVPVAAAEGVEESNLYEASNDDEVESTSDPSESLKETESNFISPNPKRRQKFSRFGTLLPTIPSSTMKGIATRFVRSAGQGKSKINKESLAAIEQATDWFFEQIGDDLGSYAEHAGRKTIDETDVITLMRR